MPAPVAPVLTTVTLVVSELAAATPLFAAKVPSDATAAPRFATDGLSAISACFLLRLSACVFCSFLTGNCAIETARCRIVCKSEEYLLMPVKTSDPVVPILSCLSAQKGSLLIFFSRNLTNLCCHLLHLGS